MENENKMYISKEESQKIKYRALIVGLDFGGNSSRHALCLSGITSDKKLYTLKTICLDANGVNPIQLYNWVSDFINICKNDYGRVDYLYADSAEQTLINGLRSQIDVSVYNSIKNEINDRIRAKIDIMADNRYRIVKEECKDIIDFYNSAVWDEKRIEDITSETFASCFKSFSGQIEGFIGKEKKEIFDFNFSTTTETIKTVGYATLMCGMQKYFEYEVHLCGCGIPYILLDGTLEDWNKIKENIKNLLNF